MDTDEVVPGAGSHGPGHPHLTVSDLTEPLPGHPPLVRSMVRPRTVRGVPPPLAGCGGFGRGGLAQPPMIPPGSGEWTVTPPRPRPASAVRS